MDLDKSSNTSETSSSDNIIPATGSARRLSILKKFQSEKAAEQERDRGKGQGASFSFNLSKMGSSLSSSMVFSSPVNARGGGGAKAKSSFRLASEGRLPGKEAGMMMKPQPLSRPGHHPPLVGTSGGGGSGGHNVVGIGGAGLVAGTGSIMRKMLEDLHNTRTRVEQSQRNFERTRRSTDDLDKRLSEVRTELGTINRKWDELSEIEAMQRTELTCLEISNKVVDETLSKADAELASDQEELFKIRMETSQLSSKYLSFAMQCGTLLNGSSFGKQNRLRYWQEQFGNLDRYRRQLEFELTDFLILQKGVEECKIEWKELETKFEEHDGVVTKQEQELQKQIDELDMALNDIKQEEKEFIRSSEEECEKLKREIEETQNTMIVLQNKGIEAKTTIKAQKIPVNAVQAVSQKRDFQNQTQAEMNPGYCEPSAKTPEMRTNEGKNFRFQTPAKSQVSTGGPRKSNLVQRNSYDSEKFAHDQNGSNDNDEDICMAAASEVSQSIRIYEPLTPAPVYSPPSKIRVVSHQLPITGFMKQLSTTKLIKRPPRNSASQAKVNSKPKPVPKAPSAPRPSASTSSSSSKNFQFKKRTSSTSSIVDVGEKENDESYSTNCSESFFDYNDNDTSSNYTTGTSFMGDEDPFSGNFELESSNTSTSVYDRPFARFSSSRNMLTDSQEEELLNKHV